MKCQNWIIILLTFAITTTVRLFAGNNSHTFPPEAENALQKTEQNRSELEKVLAHYAEKKDSLKLQAVYYLIENMDGHGYTIYSLYDTSGTEVDFDILAYPDYKTMAAAWDKIEAKRGELDFKKETQEDLQNITAEYLIDNIDLAFRAWREKPWAGHLLFEDFCDYVLPYRGSNEPLEAWRSHFLQHYQDLENKMKNPQDPIEAAWLINNDIKSWFTFDSRFYRHPTDQGLGEMLANRMGRCEDMTNLAIYAMRANGLAVTSDYTPYWADTGNNHAWNAILDRNGKVTIFMGAEANPGEYKLSHRMAKVYRKTYAQQKENLAFRLKPWEKAPRWLSRKSYKDVTSDYTDVGDVIISLEKAVPDSANYAYLCVFNDGEWKAIHWGEIKGQKVTFTAMGKNIAYLPMLYIKEELIPAGPPFILEKSGDVRKLTADTENTSTIRVLSTTRRKLVKSTDGIEKIFLEPGKEYELFYWKDSWVSVGKNVASDKPLEFDNIPQGGLYWLVAEGSKKAERIFTIENGIQVWW